MTVRHTPSTPVKPLPDLLADRGVTQQQVADLLGLSQAAVSRKVNGQRPWRLEEVRQVAGLLGVTPADVLEAVAA